ncbi:hypothetical protein TrVE_jg1079 [Triparma verrucosa]|uniref:TNFR-Cys domain-containing protein n=1 Tax=Triparma verrucosa TaxID=1606542 RepID=A0A9W7CH32_9STRA|nr:hypothetical protein TrVE_jg1079 [Triparma verrucosa]
MYKLPCREESDCLDCDAGKIQAQSGQSSCVNCVAGKYQADEGQTTCVNCVAGKYQADEGQTTCTVCSRGKSQSSEGSTTCVDCISGKIQDSEGKSSCDDCTAGKYSTSTTTCVDCADGKISDAGKSSVDDCKFCPAGSYTTDRVACLACQAGTTLETAGEGSITCENCLIGKYNGDQGHVAERHLSCTPCEAGRYADSEGSSKCTTCPSGSYDSAQGGGMTNAANCETCTAGKYSDHANIPAHQCVGGKVTALSEEMCQKYADLANVALERMTGTPTHGYGCRVKEVGGKFVWLSGGETSDLQDLTDESHTYKRADCPAVASSCSDCTAGKYLQDDGTGGNDSHDSEADCSECAAGKHSGSGVASCTICSSGKYQDDTGQEECKECSGGKYLSDAGNDVTKHDGDVDCSDCDRGKTSLPGQEACTICATGKYADELGTFDAKSETTEPGGTCKPCQQKGFTASREIAVGARAEGDLTELVDGENIEVGLGCVACLCAAGQICPDDPDDPCETCTAGKFIGTVGAKKCEDCAEGKYSGNSASVCSLCSPGEVPNEQKSGCVKCAIGKYATVRGCEECEEGYVASTEGSESCQYCEAGKRTATANAAESSATSAMTGEKTRCLLCPAGTYSAGGSKECSACPDTKLAPFAGATACQSCLPGEYIAEVSGQKQCVKCAVGKFSNQRGNTQCDDCDAGSYSSQSSSVSCSLAPPGYMVTGDQSGIISCSPGKYSEGRASECQPCEDGKYSGAGAGSCLSCGPGKVLKPDYTNKDNADYVSGDHVCVDCPIATKEASGACESCENGYVASSPGSTVCDYCGAGNFASSESNTCEDCPAATFSVGGSSHCEPCGVGKYADGVGRSECTICPAGKVTKSDQTECDTCADGKKSGLGDLYCSPCEAGSVVNEDKSNCIACGLGKFRTETDANCQDCPVGTFSDSAGKTYCSDCPAGTYADEPGNEVCKICPEGKFSGSAASACTDCPGGKISTSGSYACQSCSAGTYSNDQTQNLCKDCEAGKRSEAGASSCDNLCPAGKYGKAGEVECTNCAKGEYSRDGAGTCSTCESGKYSDTEASTECQRCGVGSVASQERTSCVDCSTGKIAEVGDLTCSTCPNGFVNASHQGNCTECPQGFIAESGDSQCSKCNTAKGLTASTPGMSSCEYCGSGTFVNLTSHACQPCPPSKYSEGGQQDCWTCETGKYADVEGQSICKDCEAGSVPNAEKTGCDGCPVGKISKVGDPTCSTCAVGKYNSENNANCLECEAGKMSNEENGAGECQICDAGKFSPVNAAACEDCSAGKYAPEPGGNGLCLFCEAGFFSGEGADSCMKCSNGTRSNAGVAICETCKAGTFKNEGTDNLCQPCEAGKISEEGSAECGLLCEAGRYSTAASSECTDCEAGKYAIIGMSSCSICSAGKYSGVRSETCTDCSPGKYSSSNEAECDMCRSDRISDAGAAICNLCEPGKTPSTDRSVCIECVPGKHANSGDEECSACDLGKSATSGSAICETCEPGKFSNEEGMEHCLVCPAGKKSNLDSTACENCNSTEYSTEGSSKCFSCPGGSYCEVGTGDPAPQCPPGTQSGSGAEACDECEPGYFAPNYGTTSCQACPANQAPTADKSDCTCKSGFIEDKEVTTDENGERQQTKVCLCGLGFTYDTKNDECVPCEVGMFKNFAGNLPCLSCDRFAVKGSFSTTSPLGGADQGDGEGGPAETASYLAISPRNCTCEKGDFLLEEKPDERYQGFGRCVRCPDGTDCDYRGITLESLPLSAGWWRSSIDSHNVVKCFAEGACVSSENFTAILELQSWNQKMQCSEGHYGAICNNCEVGYHMNVLGECEVCVKEVVLPVKTLITGIVFGSGVFLLGWFVLRKRKLKKLGRKGKGMTSSLFRKFRTKFKIMMTFYQVVSSYESVLHLRYPAVFENYTRMIGSIVNLDALKIMDVDCVVETNFYTKLIMVTATPIIFSFLCFSWAFVVGIIKPEKAKAAKDYAVEIFLGLSFLLFSNVSTTILETFNCDSFGDDPTLFLQQDQSVTCDNDTYEWYANYAIAMILVFPVGITLIYSALLIKNRKKLLDESRMEDPSLSGISFLWESYNPDCWWFEIFECVRKLCMTGLMIFIMAGSASQIVVSMLFSIASIAVYVTFKPYPCYDDDVLAICSQLSIFFTLFGGLLLRVDVADDFDQDTFGMLLIVVNSSSFVLLILTLTPKPFKWIFRIFIQQDRHNGTIKGLKPEHEDQQLFVEYFETLAQASREETGYQKIVKETATWLTWSNTTGAVMEWRNSTGLGPIDEGRVTFEVPLGIEKVKEFLLNVNCDPRSAVLEHRQLGEADLQRSMGTSNRRMSMVSSRRKLYTAIRLKWPMSNRDYVTEQFMVKSSRLTPGAQVIVSRSLYSEDGFLHEGISQKRGYVRAHVGLMGYLLIPLEDQDEEAAFENASAPGSLKMGRTKVIFVSQSDMESWFSDVLARRVVPRGLKYTVDELFYFASQEKERLLESRGKKKRKLRLKKFIKKIGKGGGSKRNLMDGADEKSSEADVSPETKAKNMWKGIRAGVNEGKTINNKWDSVINDAVKKGKSSGNVREGDGGIEMKEVVRNPLGGSGGTGGAGAGGSGLSKFRAAAAASAQKKTNTTLAKKYNGAVCKTELNSSANAEGQ